MPGACVTSRGCGCGRVAGAHRGSTLFVANHVSYLDIPVIARYVDATFVAKADVAGWPLVRTGRKADSAPSSSSGSAPKRERKGADAGPAGCRRKPDAVRRAPAPTARRSRRSSRRCSASPRPALGIELAVQPVSISYARALNGTPLVGRWRELYCWFGEATMLPTCGEW